MQTAELFGLPVHPIVVHAAVVDVDHSGAKATCDRVDDQTGIDDETDDDD